ncbi:MAG: hypothetical protein M9921_04775 [Fimbriimonadaceae bacterium]|nr:hypothetical protein [Chthonomonadaceae bacterium]MCO5296151.1 hypothetical protein [Fimbriimonadaceae bacterium]
MEVSNVSAADAVAPAASSEAKIARLQMALLRKTLDAQQEQSAELMRMMEGKGQVVDLRV